MLGNENKEENRKPDFANSRYGVSIWTNQDKNEKTYMSVKIPILRITVNCFSIEKEDGNKL